MLPRQSYKPAEWWEAQPRQWEWSLYTQNPGQQAEAIWEVRDSPWSNLRITFLASARAKAGQPDLANELDLLLVKQPEVPQMAGPPASSALSSQGNGKSQNVNLNMWGVLDWGGFMDMLDSAEKEALTEPEGMSEGPPNTMTPTTIGTGRGGKHICESQAEAPGSSSAVTTPKKAKLPESLGAQPKTTTQYTFASKDICYRDAAQLIESPCPYRNPIH